MVSSLTVAGAALFSIFPPDAMREEVLHVTNPTQRMEGTFRSSGLVVAGEGWILRLSLAAWGRPGALLEVRDAAPVLSAGRVEYRRGALTEWYLNDERGLEQGFTIHSAPGNQGALRIVLSVAEAWAGRVMPGRRSARFEQEGVVVHYHGLHSWDARGRQLPSALSLEAGRLTIDVDDDDALYPVTVDPWVATRLAVLTASDASKNDDLGFAVAVDGDTSVSGAYYHDHGFSGDGAAYVYERDAGGPGAWGETAELLASDAGHNDALGFAVAICSDTIVVGAPDADGYQGAAYVYERNRGGPEAWGETAKIASSDLAVGDAFGTSVAIRGSTIVVGAPYDDHIAINAGAAYVFERDHGGPDAWGEVAKLIENDPEYFDSFGIDVAISGDTIVVGAHGDDGSGPSNSGSAFVFERDPVAHDTWRLVQRLVASNATVSDAFGVSVALHDETIVVGASSADNPGLANYGSAYVFERRPKTGVWSEVATLIASDPSGVVAFGSSVAIRADRILVGAPESDHSSQVFAAGFAYLFHRNHGGVGVWGEALKLAAGSPASLNRFGQSVGLSGDLALIGEYKGDPPGLSNAGLSHLFTLSFATETYCTAGTSANGCLAVLSAAGSASATAGSGFVLTATAVEGERDGMFFLGARGRQASPWGNGTSLTCVIPPVRGAGLLLGTGTPGTCEGCFAQDLNALWCAVCPRPLHLSPGGLLQAQLAYRDPQNTSNRSTSLSNAIEFQMGP